VVSDVRDSGLSVRAVIRGLPPGRRVRIRARAVYEILRARKPNSAHHLRPRPKCRVAAVEEWEEEEDQKVRRTSGAHRGDPANSARRLSCCPAVAPEANRFRSCLLGVAGGLQRVGAFRV
jgi:hypothetical protein